MSLAAARLFLFLRALDSCLHSQRQRTVDQVPSRISREAPDLGQSRSCVYGVGQITADGRQVVPYFKVALYEFTGAIA